MGETSLGREEEEGVGGSVDCRVSMPRLRYRVSDRVRALDEQADCLQEVCQQPLSTRNECGCARHLFAGEVEPGPSLHASWMNSYFSGLAYLCLCHGLGVGQQSEAGSEARRDVMMK